MKELFNIIPNSTGDGFRMKLSTGVIDVPDDNGGYIISSGCGSGKTESIKSLIRQKYNSGILYCVDTRDELGKMYDWILANLVNRELGYGDILRESDVMIISSDKERSSFLNQYRDNPEILMEKKIILITHVRFWTDLINYFLIYRPQVPVDSFDGDFRKLMVRPDLRRYILFDETPTFIRPFVEFDRTILGVFSKTDDTGNITCMSPEEIGIYYAHFIRNTRNDLFNQSYRINRIKRDVALNLIPKYYDSWMLSDSDKAGITFYPVDLCPLGVYINTHVLIFEGAGDLLFKDSRNFRLLDVDRKYNCVTEFRKIDFGLFRRNLNPRRFDEFTTRIAMLINKPTLVVCWKDINGSPKKTFEGAIGAYVIVIIFFLLTYVFCVQQNVFTNYLFDNAGLLWGVGVLALLVALSIAGDLWESMLKRLVGIKDSSNLLPGHGGFFDRMDASLPVLPASAFIMLWIQLLN